MLLVQILFNLISLCVTLIHAFSFSLDSQVCYLPSSLQALHVQNPSTKAILDAIRIPGNSQVTPPPKPASIRLGYITPWNGRGYDFAKWHTSKFTHISPVWYQLSVEHNQNPQLNGRHDVDESWLKEIRGTYRPPKIVPRVQIQFSQKAAESILYYPRGETTAITEILLQEVERFGYDGLTLELPHPHIFKALVEMIGDELHEIGKELILVVPPVHKPEQAGTAFEAEHVRELEDAVDYISVMTYDHSVSLGVEGPNAPLQWMKQVVEGLHDENEYDDDDGSWEDDELDETTERLTSKESKGSKILLGLPFYGYKYSRSKGVEAYTASNYVDFLKEHHNLAWQWDEVSKEHRIIVNAGKDSISILWYPSLLSLLYRLQLAEEIGAGIAIWELGQGLDQFIDVL
ncbi:glycoside hydrolase superfamily [Xylogone sp. PMI_703]|nr:glycoside hydrolase superfamily [Xylogone sp. PMI_703]